MVSFFTHLINGLSLGSIYAIIAIGYTMVYGIAKMLNFAHGDVIMIGAFMAYTIISTMGLPTPLGIIGAIVICTVLGICIEKITSKKAFKLSCKFFCIRVITINSNAVEAKMLKVIIYALSL